MDVVRIEFKKAGFKQILTSEGTQSLVSEKATEIADKANANYGGDGFKANTILGRYGGGRYIGFVSSTDKASAQAESEDKALTGAIT